MTRGVAAELAAVRQLFSTLTGEEIIVSSFRANKWVCAGVVIALASCSDRESPAHKSGSTHTNDVRDDRNVVASNSGERSAASRKRCLGWFSRAVARVAKALAVSALVLLPSCQDEFAIRATQLGSTAQLRFVDNGVFRDTPIRRASLGWAFFARRSEERRSGRSPRLEENAFR